MILLCRRDMRYPRDLGCNDVCGREVSQLQEFVLCWIAQAHDQRGQASASCQGWQRWRELLGLITSCLPSRLASALLLLCVREQNTQPLFCNNRVFPGVAALRCRDVVCQFGCKGCVSLAWEA